MCQNIVTNSLSIGGALRWLFTYICCSFPPYSSCIVFFSLFFLLNKRLVYWMPLNLPTQKIAHIALRLIISAQYAVFFFFFCRKYTNKEDFTTWKCLFWRTVYMKLTLHLKHCFCKYTTWHFFEFKRCSEFICKHISKIFMAHVAHCFSVFQRLLHYMTFIDCVNVCLWS